MKKQKLKNSLQHLSLLLLLLGQAKIIHTMEGGEHLTFDPTTGTDLTNPTGYDGDNHNGVNHDGGDHDGGGDDGGGDDGGGDDGGDHDGNQQQPGNSTGNQNGGNSGKQNPLNPSIGTSPIDGITQGENPVVTSTDAADILKDLHTPSQKPASKSWLPKTVSDFITKVKVAWKKSFGTPEYKKAARGLLDQENVSQEIRLNFRRLSGTGAPAEMRLKTFLTEGGVLRSTMYDAITEQLLSALKADPNADPLVLLRNIENNPDIKRLQQEGQILENNLSVLSKVRTLTTSYLCIDVESQVKAILKQVKQDLLNRLNDRQKALENLAEIESAFANTPKPDKTQLQELLNEARQAVRNSGVPTDLDALTKQYEKTLGKYNDTLQSLRDSSNPSNRNHKTDEQIDKEANQIRRAKKILELLYDATVIELLKARVLKSMESNKPNEQAKTQVDIEEILKVQLKYYSLDQLTTRLKTLITSLESQNKPSDPELKYQKLVLAHIERNKTITTLLDQVNNMFKNNEPLETIEQPINKIIDLELANGKTIAELKSEFPVQSLDPIKHNVGAELLKRNWRLPEPNQIPENVPSSPEDTTQKERNVTIKTLKESLQEDLEKSGAKDFTKAQNELAEKIIKLELENGTSLENLLKDYTQKMNSSDDSNDLLNNFLRKTVERRILLKKLESDREKMVKLHPTIIENLHNSSPSKQLIKERNEYSRLMDQIKDLKKILFGKNN